MKILKSSNLNSGLKIKLSKKQWQSIGKKANWLKLSQTEIETETEIDNEINDVKKPMSWSPSVIREEKEHETIEDKWSNVVAKLDKKDTKYGKLTFVILSNTSMELSEELKKLGYKAFKDYNKNEWTWSKIVNKRGSEEIDDNLINSVISELSSNGVDTSAINARQVQKIDATPDKEGITDVSKEELDKNKEIPEEFIYWKNEMEDAKNLSLDERKKKYSEIVKNSLSEIGDMVDNPETSDRAQAIIKTLLEASSKFHNYSFYNSFMIAISRPGASYVANRDSWSRMGRTISPAATPIPIMYPIKKTLSDEEKSRLSDEDISRMTRTYFNVGSAYAYEDTQPISGWVSKRGKYKGHGPFEPPVWNIDSNEATVWLNDLYNATYSWATEVKKLRITIQNTGRAGGYATDGGVIAISDKSDGVVKVNTLFHEIAHQLIHFDPNFVRADATKIDKETDAESVAYVVASHYHVENNNASVYLAGWGSNKDKILSRFNYIKGAAVEMFEGIDDYMEKLTLLKGGKEIEFDNASKIDEPNVAVANYSGIFFDRLGYLKLVYDPMGFEANREEDFDIDDVLKNEQ